LEYAEWTFGQEVIVVTVGAVSNTLVFLLMVVISQLCKVLFNSFPRYFHKVISWIGIYAVLDPFLTAVFDILS